MSSTARDVAETLAESLVADGAEAVVLVGSHATETATELSDLDLAVVGEGTHYRLEVHDGVLVSVGWATAEEQRRRLYDPEWLGTHVPGWRTAVVLRDPQGIAEELRRAAREWTWDDVAADCDRWVAGWIVGLAEEAQKLVASLAAGDDLGSAVLRSVLVLRLAGVLALHRRVLYASENGLWETIAGELGPEWREAQESALGLKDDPADVSARSALRLYALAVAETRSLLDDRQLAVVEHALGRGAS